MHDCPLDYNLRGDILVSAKVPAAQFDWRRLAFLRVDVGVILSLLDAAEVTNFEVIIIFEENVLWLQIQMHHSFVVKLQHRISNLRNQVKDSLFIKLQCAAFHQIPKRTMT